MSSDDLEEEQYGAKDAVSHPVIGSTFYDDDPMATPSSRDGHGGVGGDVVDGGLDRSALADDDDSGPISQADSWTVISKYFACNGLVRQQIASFDEFVRNSIQEIVEDTGSIYAISAPQSSLDDGKDYRTKMQIEFGQVYITPPTRQGDASQEEALLPSACRLRQFTYSAEVECEVKRTIFEVDDETMQEAVIGSDESMVPIGRIPVMVRSMLCTLTTQKDGNWNPAAFGECPFDQGGYFIINGREKVLVAQERLAANHVMCWKDKDGRWKAELRSYVERSNRAVIANCVKHVKPSANSPVSGDCFYVDLPLVKKDIPLCVVFRALGFVSDRSILELIVYDFKDQQIMELCRPSLEESFYIQTQDVALDFIGRRGVLFWHFCICNFILNTLDDFV